MTATSNYPSPEVLIAIMNNQRDLEIARTQRWYRSANRLIRDLEQMQYLAFYDFVDRADKYCTTDRTAA